MGVSVQKTRTEYRICVRRTVWAASVTLLVAVSSLLTGCGGSPSISFAGAYFPAWLLCAVIAVLVSAVVRGLMVATGLSNHIPYQLAVCFSVGLIIALLVWQFWVVRG